MTKKISFPAKPSCDDMDDMDAFETDEFVFTVQCDGSPKPACKWTKDGAGIDTKDGHFLIKENDGNYCLVINTFTFRGHT